MNEQTNESSENVSVIQSLISRVQDLGRSVDNWNSAYMILVGFTVVLAAGVFIAQFVVIHKSKLRASLQEELLAEKDRQASIDSQDKDLKISGAFSVAGAANERAGLANERAGSLESANLHLRADLEHSIAESRSKQTELEKEQQKTAAAQEEAAKAQLELRKYIESVESKGNPRWRNLLLGGGKALADGLKGKPVAKFEILYPSEDEEAYNSAQLLKTILVGAGWTLLEVRPLKEGDALEGEPGNIPGAPLAMRSGAWFGMSLSSRTGVPNPPWEHVNDSAIAALMDAMGGGQSVPTQDCPMAW